MEDFIELFKEAIEREDVVYPSDKFREYDEWDSLAYLSVIAMIDEEFDLQIEQPQFKELQTIQDLYNVVSKK